MFASSNRSMISDSWNEFLNLTDGKILQFTSPTTTVNEELWENIKAFFNPHNSLIILAIICLIFFFITLCLVIIIFQLLKKKRFNEPQRKPVPNSYPKFDFPSSPFQMGLTSNQITSTNKLPEVSSRTINSLSAMASTKTQSFDNFETELKRTWNEKGITSSMADEEIETVNEVLGMEERNGKVYYKVNFTGHPSDYTAWVCEEDLIPE